MNTYHNFQHALDVFQATYFFLYTAGVVPPVSILLRADARLWQPDKRTLNQGNSFISCLENEDVFALYIAAVGHDVGHPGLTNNFLVSCISAPLPIQYSSSDSVYVAQCQDAASGGFRNLYAGADALQFDHAAHAAPWTGHASGPSEIGGLLQEIARHDGARN